MTSIGKTCSECDLTKLEARGLCQKHYARLMRHGSPLALKKEKVNSFTEEAIKTRSEVDQNGCWIWQGAPNNKGYGRIAIQGKRIYAHRASFMIFNGSINDLNVLHKCDVPLCVNPEHLFLGTQQENVTDMMQKGRHRYA